MGISLYLLTTITVTSIVFVVAAACLGVSLATVNSTISSVGKAWATGISHSAVNSIATYFNDIQGNVKSASALAQQLDLTTPINDAVYRGINWTDIWIPFMLRYCTNSNEKNPLMGLIFIDGCWCFTALSILIDPTAGIRAVEWVENLQNLTRPAAENQTVGGFLYDPKTMSTVPYPARTVGGHDVFATNQSLVNPPSADLVNLFQLSYDRDPSQHSHCLAVTFNTYQLEQGLYWQVYFVCSIISRGGKFLGYSSVPLDLEADITSLLKRTKHSPHAEAFVVSMKADTCLVFGSTRPEKFYTGYFQSRLLPYPARCFSTDELFLGNFPSPWIACPFDIHTYPYAPLNAISVEFATTKSFVFDFFNVGGSTTAIASERLPTTIIGLVWNIVTVLPEEDLYLGTIRSSIAMSVGLAVLVAAVGVFISLVALHFLIKRLQNIQEKMIDLANLEVLDKDDDLRDIDEEITNTVETGSVHTRDGTSAKAEEDQRERDREKESSWISEVAHLESAYAATVKSMTSFTRYVSRAVVKELILQRKQAEVERDREMLLSPHAVAIGGAGDGVPGVSDASLAAQYEVTVLFADIEGFSSQIWATNPENHDGVLYILHVYFRRMCRLIMGHGGVVDKFMGDSIMSYWGAPVRIEHHALLATLTALALLRESRRDPLKKIFAQSLRREVQLRCGLSTGNAIVGTFGNDESVNYSVVGNPVSQARHVQDFNRYWCSSILMDANCMRKVDETIVHRLICQALFEPAGRPAFVYEVMGLNVESALVRRKVTADARTIAFTDVLSLPTINSANEGVSELLKHSAPETETSLDALLIWHAKGRSSLPASYLTFAEQFSEAARCVVDMKFAEAVDLFTKLLQSSTTFTSPGSSNPILQTGDATNPTVSSSSHHSSSSAVSPTTSPIYKLSIATDSALETLKDISNVYSNRSVSSQSVDRESSTFFIRAFRLDIIGKKISQSSDATKK